MNQPIVQSPPLFAAPGPVTIVGGGPLPLRALRLALARAPRAVAVDGGADRLLRAGVLPEAVIGDLDSLSDAARAVIPADRLHRIDEQATTDFDKALRSVAAPLVLAAGFAGGRTDHALAVLNTLVRHADRPCIVIGEADVTFAAPPRPLHLALRPGDALSLFPLAAVTGRSSGLRWPIDGLDFAPDGFIGTSNAVAEPAVTLDFARPGMLVIVPRRRLDAVMAALMPAGRSARGG